MIPGQTTRADLLNGLRFLDRDCGSGEPNPVSKSANSERPGGRSRRFADLLRGFEGSGRHSGGRPSRLMSASQHSLTWRAS